MIAIILIALAAGCASALMFASIISGALISLLLFYLAPLPLMVAAIGWGPLSAMIGGIGAATVLFAVSAYPTAPLTRSRLRCPPGGSVISPCWDGRCPMPLQAMARHRQRPHWNGIRSAASWSGSPALPS